MNEEMKYVINTLPIDVLADTSQDKPRCQDATHIVSDFFSSWFICSSKCPKQWIKSDVMKTLHMLVLCCRYGSLMEYVIIILFQRCKRPNDSCVRPRGVETKGERCTLIRVLH